MIVWRSGASSLIPFFSFVFNFFSINKAFISQEKTKNETGKKNLRVNIELNYQHPHNIKENKLNDKKGLVITQSNYQKRRGERGNERNHRKLI